MERRSEEIVEESRESEQGMEGNPEDYGLSPADRPFRDMPTISAAPVKEYLGRLLALGFGKLRKIRAIQATNLDDARVCADRSKLFGSGSKHSSWLLCISRKIEGFVSDVLR